MLKTKRLWLYLLFSAFFLVQCLPIQAVNQPLPDRDIVFQLDTHYTGGGEDRIGFINADGSGETYLYTVKVAAVVEPIWTDDGNLLLFVNPADYIEGITQEGFRMRLEGSYWVPNISPIHGKEEVLIESSHEDRYVIKRIDLNSGEVLEIYQVCKYKIDDPDDTPEGISLGTNNLYNQQLLYERWWVSEKSVIHAELIVLNTDTNERHILLENRGDEQNTPYIMNPAFSLDGQWIAYTANDGIYLIRSDGSENHQIVKSEIVNLGYWPPVASWSPDGQWIVYHRCMLNDKESCRYNVEDSTIFKYNIETGEEIPLVEGGVNPYWRWREESP